MLRLLARFNFNCLGDLHSGFRNFRDSGGDETTKLVVVRRRHSAGDARGRLNKKCLFHSRFPISFVN